VASLAVEGSPTAPPAVQIPSDGPHRTTVAFKRLGPPFPFRVSSPYFISPVARLSPPLLLFFLAGSCLCLTPAASGEAARPRPSGGRAPAVLRFVSRWFIPRSVRACFSFASGGRGGERKLGSWTNACVLERGCWVR
jgi:hypothetical protein